MAVNILMDVPKILLGGWSHGLQVTNFNFTKKLEFFYGKKCFHEQVLHSICFRNKSLFFSIGWNLYRSNCGSYYSTGFDTKNYQTNSKIWSSQRLWLWLWLKSLFLKKKYMEWMWIFLCTDMTNKIMKY